MPRNVDNSEDILDSRDIIARIEELEALKAKHCETCGGSGEVAPEDVDSEESVSCDDCEGTGEAIGTLEADDRAELAALLALQEQAEGYADDWQHGTALIRDSYFEDYAQELAEDIGAIDPNATWPLNCIDWQQAARELQMDYTSVEFGDVTYWVR